MRFGPRKTTMDEVAREAGCSRTTLYAHFRNMDALYGSPLQQDVEEGALRSIEPGRVSTRQEGTTADAVLCCIDAGHRVAEKALAERSDWEPFASALAQDWEVEP